jgi:hypothetical protein
MPSNSCDNSAGGPESRNKLADTLDMIVRGGDAFQKRLDQFQAAKKAADAARADAEAAAVHAQEEITRIRVYVADIKRDADKEAADILGQAKAKIRAWRLELEKFKP